VLSELTSWGSVSISKRSDPSLPHLSKLEKRTGFEPASRVPFRTTTHPTIPFGTT
jgi:hypothetical protein